MYPRILHASESRSFFLFGPRGTGKSSWLRQQYQEATYIDLLDDGVYRSLLAKPERLQTLIPPEQRSVVIDEVQRIPSLLNEVHRLIETKSIQFVLSSSSARSLRQQGVNLLAGRASTRYMHPLTALELGKDFSVERALQYGLMPEIWDGADEEDYLKSYITTYLKEEVQQEGLARNLGTFSRFLETASFSQASPLNVSEIARSVGVSNKTAESYFSILEDLLLAVRLPVFQKHAKRDLYRRAKFYFFDTGIFRFLRPRGPLDSPEFIDVAALETLLFQETRAINDYQALGYDFFYWRTRDQKEVDLILYGERGLHAFEIKRASQIRKADLNGLQAFREDYPMAKAYLLFGGAQREYRDGIELIPYQEAIQELSQMVDPSVA
ncbi:AAA family ATPase [bacterium]|nr:AAA family ATPase [bacterium]